MTTSVALTTGGGGGKEEGRTLSRSGLIHHDHLHQSSAALALFALLFTPFGSAPLNQERYAQVPQIRRRQSSGCTGRRWTTREDERVLMCTFRMQPSGFSETDCESRRGFWVITTLAPPLARLLKLTRYLHSDRSGAAQLHDSVRILRPCRDAQLERT